MNADLWLLPGVRDYIRNIVRDLLVGRSVFLKFPQGFEHRSVVQLLKDELRREEAGWFSRKSVSSLSERASLPCLALMEEFDVPADDDSLSENLRKLASSENFAGRILQLDDLDTLDESVRKKWWEFIKDFSVMAKSIDNFRRTRFVIPVSNYECESAPGEDVLIAHHWWWGVLSRPEVSYVLDKASRESGAFLAWSDTVILELAGFDPDFGLFLLEEDLAGNHDISESCRSYAEKQGWSKYIDDLKKNYESTYHMYFQQENLLAPSEMIKQYWYAGIVNQFKGSLPDFHTAALSCAGFEEEITRRIWRGQNRELMNMIDLMRVRVCDHLTRRFGLNWTSWFKGESRLKDKTTLEIGQLGGMFKMAPEIKRVETEVRDMVMWMHFTRNELTHLRPISRSKLYEGMEIMREVTKIV